MTWVAIEMSSAEAERLERDDPVIMGWGDNSSDRDSGSWTTDAERAVDVIGLRVMPEGWSPYNDDEVHG